MRCGSVAAGGADDAGELVHGLGHRQVVDAYRAEEGVVRLYIDQLCGVDLGGEPAAGKVGRHEADADDHVSVFDRMTHRGFAWIRMQRRGCAVRRLGGVRRRR
jgi:hypothetical protein